MQPNESIGSSLVVGLTDCGQLLKSWTTVRQHHVIYQTLDLIIAFVSVAQVILVW